MDLGLAWSEAASVMLPCDCCCAAHCLKLSLAGLSKASPAGDLASAVSLLQFQSDIPAELFGIAAVPLAAAPANNDRGPSCLAVLAKAAAGDLVL